MTGTAPPGRMIHTRVVFKPLPTRGYGASVPIWGFAYDMEITRDNGDVVLTVFDGGTPVGAYRQPMLDDTEATP